MLPVFLDVAATQTGGQIELTAGTNTCVKLNLFGSYEKILKSLMFCRQQQPFIPSAAATATGPVMYHPIVFQPTHMGMQTYQQPRSSTPG